MIPYELAQQLKDAGFPFKPAHCSFDKIIYFSEPKLEPTLSELIAACGDGFYSLVYALENDWRCFSEREGDYIDTADGKTPEEAVARLYLALNDKKQKEAQA